MQPARQRTRCQEAPRHHFAQPPELILILIRGECLHHGPSRHRKCSTVASEVLSCVMHSNNSILEIFWYFLFTYIDIDVGKRRLRPASCAKGSRKKDVVQETKNHERFRIVPDGARAPVCSRTYVQSVRSFRR